MTENEQMPTIIKTELGKKFTDEILNPSIDLGTDYAEIFIDDLMDNGLLKEIPIVKSVVGTIKAGISINQFWFAKKILTFIREFNLGNVDNKQRIKFQQKINTNDKFRKKVVEQIMIFIDKHMEINKTKISAKLFQAFVEENLTYEEFVSTNICLDKLHPDSYSFINYLATIGYEINHEFKNERNFDAESLLLTSGLATETSSFWHGFRLKNEGIKLYEYGIKPLTI
ncbi:MAG: hypothetical protein FWH23_02425 [Bacteroidales bacterium]|nr:hypothetical protein [Bacteroidales bacterium]MCL2132799.1 hypothetical protein [Bacteroidales bacterium]